MTTGQQTMAGAGSQCPHCLQYSAFPLAHPTLGKVCQHCLRPIASRRPWPWTRPPKFSPTTAVAPPPSKRRKRNARRRSADTCNRLAERDGWRCHLCGDEIDPAAEGVEAPTIDHLVPVSRGGTGAMENLKLAHWRCNNARGNQLLGETA